MAITSAIKSIIEAADMQICQACDGEGEVGYFCGHDTFISCRMCKGDGVVRSLKKHHPEICFDCGEGTYDEVIEDYRRELPEGETLIVPKLLVLRCTKCHEETIPPESSRRIEAAVEASRWKD